MLSTHIKSFRQQRLINKGRILLLGLALTFTHSALAEAQLPPKDKVVIAGIKAKWWGPPAPFIHAKKGPGYALMTFIFDSLVWRDKAGEFSPLIADNWEINATQDTFSFALNPKALWHDGRKLTADDVVFTIDYMQKRPYIFADVEAIKSVEAKDAHHVVIHTKKSFPAFMSNIAVSMPILPKHIYKDVKNPVKFTDTEAFIGSGPYRLKNYDRVNKSYVFSAFPDYHRGIPRVAEIAIQPVAPAAVMKMVKSIQTDLVTSVSPKQEKPLKKAGFKLLSFSAIHPIRLKFNLNKPLFKDLSVRQAFAKGIDRQALIDKAYQKKAELWSAGAMHTLAADKNDKEIVQYDYDPNALKGVIPADTTLKLVTDKRIKKAAQVLATQLKNAGVNVELLVTERGVANAMFRKGDYDLGLVTFTILGDPIIFQQTATGKRIDGDNYHENKVLTELLNQQINEIDPAKRAEMIRQASIIYAKEVPSVSLISTIRTVAYRPESLQVYWHGHGLGRGIPILLDKDFFAKPFRKQK
ncbi:MAG: hypothetical protein CSA45_01895 [Gammaproteobacteria bacterium]|nr:MAG: hypothetical protein CSA45_01895 [Gammaproteobacteria bacterium]